MTEEKEVNCYICGTVTDECLTCDRCDNYYCEECSYIFGIYYQFQGARCYRCSEQTRIKPLLKEKVRESIIENLIK